MENGKRKETIIAVVVGIVLIAIVVISWIMKTVGSRNDTGGLQITDDGAVVTTDVSDIVAAGFPQKLYKDFSEDFFEAFMLIDPTCGKITKAKNIEADGNTYNFEIIRCNVTYNIEVSNNGDKDYSFTIKQGDEMLVSYNSANNERTYLAAETLYKFLPMNMSTNDGQKYTITQKNKNNPLELEIGTDNCGSQEKKNKAIESAKEVLEYTGFNPEDFTYVTPNYCDKEQ